MKRTGCAELRPRGVQIIVNPDFEHTDMLASIRCGLAELPPQCRAVLVVPGDQPAVSVELIDALIDCFATCMARDRRAVPCRPARASGFVCGVVLP